MVCRIAVVGAGPLVGRQHCGIINDLPGVELACLCQRRLDDAEMAESFGVPLYTDAYKMASEQDLDGIVIAAPTHLHLPLSKACIAGAQERQAKLSIPEIRLRALLVEKPLCENLTAAQELCCLAAEAGVEILAGHQRRHSAFVQKARSLVTDLNFGPLRGVTVEFSLLKPDGYFSKHDPKLEWRKQKGKGGPLLINIIHDIDLLRYITGHEIVNVFAVTSSAARGTEVEDTGAITVTFDHGAVGTIFFSDAAPSPWSYEFTTGENKKYPSVPPMGEQKDCYHFLGAQRSLGFPSLRAYTYGPEVNVRGWDAPLTLEESHVEMEDPLRRQMAHFAEVCMGREKPICSGSDAAMSLAVVLAALKSADTGNAVQPGGLFTLPKRRSSTASIQKASQKAGSYQAATTTICSDDEWEAASWDESQSRCSKSQHSHWLSDGIFDTSAH